MRESKTTRALTPKKTLEPWLGSSSATRTYSITTTPKPSTPLNRAKLHAGDLGDYVAYYLGTSYLQTGRTAEALATLADFGKAHPDSLLVRDARVCYANALLQEGQAAEAASALEQDPRCRYAPTWNWL